MYRPEALWKLSWSGTPATYTYTDTTSNIRTNSAITFMSSTSEYFYIGFPRRFVGLFTNLSTNGSYTGITIEYMKDDSTWESVQQIDTYTFNTSKYIRWNLPQYWMKFALTTSEPHTVSSVPDNVERYWIRVYATAVTTAAVISKMRVIPYSSYSTPTKVYQLLGLKKDFDNSTTPTDLTIEDYIRRVEDRIDYRTRKSWRFNAVTETNDPVLVDYNRYGFFLRHRDFTEVYSIKIWTGSDWQTLTEGRNNDYFINYNLGMVYLTRLFLLPATYGMTGRYFHWGYGEYKHSVQADYVYGRDPETNTEFGIIEDVATKLAAVDVLRHHDYTILFPSGTDKVSLDVKIKMMEDQCEMKLDELTGVFVH